MTIYGAEVPAIRQLQPNPLPATGDVKQDQEADLDLSLLSRWLRGNVTPPSNELALASPVAKYYWINKDQYRLKGGVIWKQTVDGKLLLVLPKSMQEEVLRGCHDIPSAGHQGIDRTTAKVKEKYSWYGLSKAVKLYVLSCDICNAHKKPNRHARFPLTNFQAGAPMERVHLDFMGPLPATSQGNEYILMMVDQFSKWVECIALPSQTAEVTAHAAITEFFSRFGYPFQIHTDRGSNFESQLFAAVCELLQIHKTRTTPYRPSANGQVERYTDVMDATRCYIKNRNEWDRHLSQLAGALRSSVNRDTGFTPNMLMLGREVNQPVNLMFPEVDKERSVLIQPGQYVSELETAITSAHHTAREKLKTTQQRMKKDYDLKVLEKCYSVGDPVYILDTSSMKGKGRKLRPPWKGPGIILENISAAVYRIKHKNTVFTMNHDRIKLCRDRQLPAWIVRLRNNAELLQETLKAAKRNSALETVYCHCRKPDDGK